MMLFAPHDCLAETTAVQNPARTRLTCLGRFAAQRQGQVLGTSLDATALALLQRVIAAGPRGAARDKLFEQLWSVPAHKATPRFAAAHRVLSQSLQVTRVFVLTPDSVAIDRSEIDVDALSLESTLEPILFSGGPPRMSMNQREAIAALLATYEPFLPQCHEPWAVVARLRIRDQVRRAEAWIPVPPAQEP